MKTLIQSMMIAGAALVAAGAANAQNMNVQVPFEFTVSGVKMSAGNYKVEAVPRPGQTIFQVTNRNVRKSVFAPALGARQVPRSAKQSTVTFTCAATGCELTEVASAVRGEKWSVAPSKKLREAIRAGAPVQSVQVQAD